jgi:hypothetical protein
MDTLDSPAMLPPTPRIPSNGGNMSTNALSHELGICILAHMPRLLREDFENERTPWYFRPLNEIIGGALEVNLELA